MEAMHWLPVRISEKGDWLGMGHEIKGVERGTVKRWEDNCNFAAPKRESLSLARTETEKRSRI